MQGMYPYSISRKQSEIAMGEDEMRAERNRSYPKTKSIFQKLKFHEVPAFMFLNEAWILLNS